MVILESVIREKNNYELDTLFCINQYIIITIVTKEEEKRRKKRHQLLSPFCIETTSIMALFVDFSLKGRAIRRNITAKFITFLYLHSRSSSATI